MSYSLGPCMDCQYSLSSTISQSLLKFMSIESVMLSNQLILSCPLLFLPSIFPRIRVFSNGSALPWDFPSRNTGVGCHFLLQGIFLTQGSKPMSPAWQVGSLPLTHQWGRHTHICIYIAYTNIYIIYTYTQTHM